MRVVRYLQHWLSGPRARLQITDFAPVMHPIRQWADTFPWAVLVSAIEQSFDKRFPKTSLRGRRPVPVPSRLRLGGEELVNCPRRWPVGHGSIQAGGRLLLPGQTCGPRRPGSQSGVWGQDPVAATAPHHL